MQFFKLFSIPNDFKHTFLVWRISLLRTPVQLVITDHIYQRHAEMPILAWPVGMDVQPEASLLTEDDDLITAAGPSHDVQTSLPSLSIINSAKW